MSIVSKKYFNFYFEVTVFIDETFIIVIYLRHVVLFKPILSFRILYVNTTIHDYTINCYCYRHQYFTVYSLQVIISIVFGNSINHRQKHWFRISSLFHIKTITINNIFILIVGFISILQKLYFELTLFVVDTIIFIIKGSEVFLVNRYYCFGFYMLIIRCMVIQLIIFFIIVIILLFVDFRL